MKGRAYDCGAGLTIGTTLVAAAQARRNAVGIEIEKKYCAVARACGRL